MCLLFINAKTCCGNHPLNSPQTCFFFSHSPLLHLTYKKINKCIPCESAFIRLLQDLLFFPHSTLLHLTFLNANTHSVWTALKHSSKNFTTLQYIYENSILYIFTALSQFFFIKNVLCANHPLNIIPWFEFLFQFHYPASCIFKCNCVNRP